MCKKKEPEKETKPPIRAVVENIVAAKVEPKHVPPRTVTKKDEPEFAPKAIVESKLTPEDFDKEQYKRNLEKLLSANKLPPQC